MAKQTAKRPEKFQPKENASSGADLLENLRSDVESIETNELRSEKGTEAYLQALELLKVGVPAGKLAERPEFNELREELDPLEFSASLKDAKEHFNNGHVLVNNPTNQTLWEKYAPKPLQEFRKEHPKAFVAVTVVAAVGLTALLFKMMKESEEGEEKDQKSGAKKKWGIGAGILSAIGLGNMIGKDGIKSYIGQVLGVDFEDLEKAQSTFKKGVDLIDENKKTAAGVIALTAAANKGDTEGVEKALSELSGDEVIVQKMSEAYGNVKTKAGEMLEGDYEVPEVVTNAMERSREIIKQDLREVHQDFAKAFEGMGLKNILDEHALKIENLDQVHELQETEGIADEAATWMTVEITRNLFRAELMLDIVQELFENGWSIAFDSGEVILVNGSKILVRSMGATITEPLAAMLTDKTGIESLFSYAAESSTLIMFGASAGAVWGGLKGLSGGTGVVRTSVVQAAKGAAKASVFPIYATYKTYDYGARGLYTLQNFRDYGAIHLDQLKLAGQFAKLGLTKVKNQGIINWKAQEAREINMKAAASQYDSVKKVILERRKNYYETMLHTKRFGPFVADSMRIRKQIDGIEDSINKIRSNVDFEVMIDTILSRKEFKKISQKSRELLTEYSADFKVIILNLADQPNSAYSKAILNNPELIEMIASDWRFRDQMGLVSTVRHFEDPTFKKVFERVMAEDISPEKKIQKLSKKLRSLRTGKVSIERILEADEALVAVKETATEAITKFQDEAFAMQDEIKKGFAAALAENPEMKMQEFLEGPGKALKDRLDSINGKIKGATEDFVSGIAKELSGGKISKIEDLPKGLRQKAEEFIIHTSGPEVPIANRKLAKIMGKRLAGRLVIAAPLVGLSAFIHGERVDKSTAIKSAAASMTPLLGTGLDFYSFATGKDYFDESVEVSRLESLGWGISGLLMDVLVLAGGSGVGARIALRGARSAGKLSNKGQKVAEAIEATGKAIAESGQLKKAATAGFAGMTAFTVGNIGVEWITTPEEVVNIPMGS